MSQRLTGKGDPLTVAGLAREAEEAGWDGAFYWDGIYVGEMETYDPWVVMAATEAVEARPGDYDAGPPLGRPPGVGGRPRGSG
jgi:hypothetical protein